MIKRWAWALVKPLVARWLAERALRLPARDVEETARAVGASADVVRRVNDLFTARVLADLDRFSP